MNSKAPIKEKTLKNLNLNGKTYHYYSLPDLAAATGRSIDHLPVSIRIVLESVLRHSGTERISDQDVHNLLAWDAKNPSSEEIPFTVARIVLQDFTGVPLLVDLAAMRSAVEKLGKDPKNVEPLVPVDLVIDHSVQVDYSGVSDALDRNIKREFERNKERYEFLKWGQQAFNSFKVVPPGIGIVHQVNLEYLARGVLSKEEGGKTFVYPDTLVGTDSHTTMINGIGVVGWGVGGIEAEAGMLGQPVSFLTPEVVGFRLSGELSEGVTATDMVLTVTQMLREAKVVGKFVEFFGPGATKLVVTDRATISNMAPEYGATMGFFPVDDKTIEYLQMTGRSTEQVELVKEYYKAQGLYGIPQSVNDVQYSEVLELDLSSVKPSVAGPKRPQDRIAMPELGQQFERLFSKPKAEGGFGKNDAERKALFKLSSEADPLRKDLDNQPISHGDVLIAAITSCTNTSNPSVMLAAGLVAKKAVERGLKVNPKVKTSLAPGSRVVTDYLNESHLQEYLDKLGFNLVGYGCTTCIGNSGPLSPAIESALAQHDLVTASVLSGNRNFEARVHPSIRANFLMSPPLVVAYALAGTVCIDLAKDPIAKDKNGKDVYLKDLWPTMSEIQAIMKETLRPEVFQRLYRDFDEQSPAWKEIKSSTGISYDWDEKSTYIQHPPFFDGFTSTPAPVKAVENARILLLLGDSVTTDHISPAGSFKADTPAGRYLSEHGVEPRDFNSFGSRRGNDRVMTRGTFANVRVKNEMLEDGREGGYTKNFLKNAEVCSVFDAAEDYQKNNIPLVVFGGKEYGTGSSRDWAAKGTLLLGVRAVITESFERIHRSNLVGMGVLPLTLKEGTTLVSLKLKGDELVSLAGVDGELKCGADVVMTLSRADGKEEKVTLTARLDTPVEIEYFRHGGILPYVARQLL